MDINNRVDINNKANINNRGVTLIELIISMAIMSIILTMIVAFINVGTKNYSAASDEIDIQIESQMVMNQLENILLEANWVELDDVNTEDRALVIYSLGDICAVIYDKSSMQLFYVDGLSTEQIKNLSSITYTEDENLMANHIFNIQLLNSETQMFDDKGIKLAINFKSKSRVAKEVRTIYFRNQLVRPVATP